MGSFELIGIPAVLAVALSALGAWSLTLPRVDADQLTRVELTVLPVSCFVLAAVAAFLAVFFGVTG